MARFLFIRLLQTLPVLWAVATLTFFMVRYAPGGPFTAEKTVPPEILKRLEAHYGLDKPLGVQYVVFLKSLVTGTQPSIRHATRTVGEIIRESFPVSLELGAWALLIALVIGLPAGMLAAQKPNSWQDYVPMSAAMVGVGLPTFVLGPLMVLVFSLKLGWFNTSGWSTPGDRVLPAVTLGCHLAAYVARLTRGGMLEIMGQDFIRTARAKGASGLRILTRHALRGGLLPVITFLGPAAAGLITGSFVIETVFNIPGLGKYFVGSVFDRDIPVVGGTVFFFAALILFFNLLVDIVQAWLNPKVRLE
ncbi:MAG: ABC transporter permease [Proteobacteria bacterium]|nr:ABC transporter permease [Pseudomonadota bacterium]